jgi:Fe-S cluster assembly protein SufD
VGEGSHVSYVKIIDDTPALHHIGHVVASVAHSGTFTAHSINLNAGFIRNDAQIRLAGELSQGFLYGASILDQTQYVDNHTVVDHIVPHCHSEELYKGVYNGSSTGVFNGKIYVRPQAQKTTAYQSSHSLLLSGKAQVNAKPQLEIWADDVKCSHGATTGQLNEDAVFYLQARGIERSKAVSLLTFAFAAEVLDTLPYEELREHLMKRLSVKLGAEGL